MLTAAVPPRRKSNAMLSSSSSKKPYPAKPGTLRKASPIVALIAALIKNIPKPRKEDKRPTNSHESAPFYKKMCGSLRNR